VEASQARKGAYMDEYDCWCVVQRFIKKKEYDRAIEFCETEPYSRFPYCRNYLGWTFYEQNNYEASAYWFGKASQQDNGEAFFGMGCIHLVQKNWQSALSCLENAANKEFPRAYFWIALIYYHGGGSEVPRDFDRATHYFRIAADHDSLMAKRFILLFESKEGVWRRVVSWFKLIPLLVEAWVISARNPYDSRIVDIGYQHKRLFPNPAYKQAEF
jgi:tetratricopeptide (TPR) repeat protein